MRLRRVYLTSDGTLMATVTETSPGAGCGVLAVITYPVAAMAVERAATVVFSERQQTHRCE